MFELRRSQRPYPGLRTFEPHEADIFFGRESHTDRLLGILQRERFLAVIGPSGSGKSSLVRAGLLPALAMGSLGTGSDWRVAVLRPGHQPMLRLAQALLAPQVLGAALLPEDQPQTAEDELRRGPLGLVHLVKRAQQRSAAAAPETTPTFNLLVLVDQFEEIFTYAGAGGAQADESDAFVNLLLAAKAAPGARIFVALTMRTDFLGQCVRFLELPEAINHAQYLTPRLKRAELATAIAGPAAVFGGEIDAGLVAELINASGQQEDQLPLVQHALARMWAQAQQRQPDAPVLDWAVAEAVGVHHGNMMGALNQHADELLHSLSEEQQTLAEGLFRAITERRQASEGGQDVRRPQKLSLIAQALGCSTQDLMPVVACFAADDVCFLQHGLVLNADSVIDLSHEALIRQWGTLKTWVTHEDEWAKGFRHWRQRCEEETPRQGLLAGAELERALQWTAQPDSTEAQEGVKLLLTEDWAMRYAPPKATSSGLQSIIDFIQASRAAEIQHKQDEAARVQRELDMAEQGRQQAEQHAQTLRRRNWILGVLMGLSLLLATGAGWFWWQANQSAQEQVRLTKVAEKSAQEQARLTQVANNSAKEQARLAQVAEKSAQEQARLTQVANNSAEEQIRLAAVAKAAEASAVAQARLAQANAEKATTAEQHAQREAERAGLAASAAEAEAQKVTKAKQHLQATLVESTAVRLAAESSALFTGERAGGTLQALRFALAAYRAQPENTEVLANLQRTVFGNKAPWLLGMESASPVTSVAFSPDGLRIVSGSDDNTLRLWDAKTGLPIGQPLTGHSNWVTSVAFSPDGLRIVSGSSDKTLRLWDAKTGQPIGQPLKGHSYNVWSVAFSPDGLRIVSGSSDNTLRLWNAKTSQPIGQPLTGHYSGVTSVAFSPDGLRIVSGSDDDTLRLWDAKTGRPIGQYLKGHSRSVSSVAFSPDSLRIVSGSLDNTLRLWDAKTGLPIGQPLPGHSGDVLSVAFSPDGLRIISGSLDNSLRLWDAKTGQPISLPLTGHSESVTSVAFSPDGLRIVSGSEDKTLRLWNAKTGQSIRPPLTEHSSLITSVAFSPDGLHLISGSWDGTLRLWDAKTGLPISQPLAGHSSTVWSLAFSPDGLRIVSGGEDNTLRLWDAKTGLPIGRPLAGHSSSVHSVAFSPDGLRIVSGSEDNTLRLWDAKTGIPIDQPLKGHSSSIWSAAFSPDGLRIVSGSRDNTLRLWDTKTGLPIGQPLAGHSRTVTSVAFSPDGLRIVSGSPDNTLRLWDAKTGLPIGQPLKGHSESVTSVAFSPDGLRIVSGSEDGTLRLWPAPAAWPSLLCSKLTRNFSHKEWQRYVGANIAYQEQCPGLPVPADEATP
jgi:WD40 repeat protein/cytoskeletal protein RodZ